MSATTGADTAPRTAVPLTSEHPLAQVDLLPPEILADRRFRTARGWMALAVVGTLGLSGGGFFLASADADAAAEELAAEQAITTQLRSEEAQFAAVPAILASVDRARTARETAMATDVLWYRYLTQMASLSPETIWFTGITITTTPPGTVSAGSDPLAPVDTVADVVTTGRALSYPDVASWMDQLGSVSGFDHVLFTTAVLDEASGEKPWVDFQVSAKVLSDAYSDRYLAEAE